MKSFKKSAVLITILSVLFVSFTFSLTAFGAQTDTFCQHQQTYTDDISYCEYQNYGNDTYHKTVNYYNKYCSNCGAFLDTVIGSDYRYEKHDWQKVNDKIVCKCGAVKCSTITHTDKYGRIWNESILELEKQKRLYVTDAYGNIYRRELNSAGTQINDVYIAFPSGSQVRFDANSIYVAGGTKYSSRNFGCIVDSTYSSWEPLKLYQKKSGGDVLYSMIPEKIQWSEWRIEEFKFISSSARDAYYNNKISYSAMVSIQNTASDRESAYKQAEKGIFNQTFLDYQKRSFVVQRQYEGYTQKDAIKDIQTRLGEIGYLNTWYSNYNDGYYSIDTFKAVAKYQIDNGLDVTGQVDQTTYDLLFRQPSKGNSSVEQNPF